QKVGPTMADDIKSSAVIAVLIAMLGIGLYIFLRFSRLAYSGGALLALAHDTLFILLLYCILPLTGVVPFSLEVDQSFIAAILTVIGYSINDKVVIFDRIREFIHNRKGADFDKCEVFNSAISSTLSRTFSTSLSTLIVLVIIFFFGGDTIRGFIFAMLIGVIVGTYSSIFIAAPFACKYYSAKADEEEEAKRIEKEKRLAERA
ncbi:MAG: protein translocase subunit SecF, partial [Paludibacteraceae bacterium]|nr:protein translocase subunit SecF [Paludibacteraceae bacterium]